MRQIIVHIGLPKCGSSSIQSHMATFDDRHRAEGVCYPRAGRSQGGYRNHAPIAKTGTAGLRQVIEQVTAEFRSDPRLHTGFVSAEDWSTSHYFDNLSEVLSLLSELNPEAKVSVLAYFRNPFGYVESCYAQMVKGGLFGIDARKFFLQPKSGIEEFVAHFLQAEGHPIYSLLSNARQISKAADGFPVSYRSIEAGDLTASSLLADLCATLGLNPDESTGNKPKNERINLRQLVVLKQARQVFSVPEFMLLRPYLLEHPLCHDVPGQGARIAVAHVGSDLAEKIRTTLAHEFTELADIFDTPVAQLCADTWQPVNTDKVIEDDEVRLVTDEAMRVLQHCRRPLFQNMLQKLAEQKEVPAKKRLRRKE